MIYRPSKKENNKKKTPTKQKALFTVSTQKRPELTQMIVNIFTALSFLHLHNDSRRRSLERFRITLLYARETFRPRHPEGKHHLTAPLVKRRRGCARDKSRRTNMEQKAAEPSKIMNQNSTNPPWHANTHNERLERNLPVMVCLLVCG